MSFLEGLQLGQVWKRGETVCCEGLLRVTPARRSSGQKPWAPLGRAWGGHSRDGFPAAVPRGGVLTRLLRAACVLERGRVGRAGVEWVLE